MSLCESNSVNFEKTWQKFIYLKKNSEISEYISMWQYERHLMSYKNHNLQN